MTAADLIYYFLAAADTSDSGTSSEKVAYYGMWSALGVALIGGLFALAKTYFGNAGSAVRQRKIVKEHEAMERFLLINNFDVRKIKTGYEPIEEVRGVVHLQDPG